MDPSPAGGHSAFRPGPPTPVMTRRLMVFLSTDACVSAHAMPEFRAVGFAVMVRKPETSPCTGKTQPDPTFLGLPMARPPTDIINFQLATSADAAKMKLLQLVSCDAAAGATSVPTKAMAA